MRHQGLAALLLANALMPWQAAKAADAGWLPEHPGDFGVRFVQYDLSLSDKTRVLDSTVKQISFGFREGFGDHVRAGLLGGYSYLSQDDNPATAGEQLNGWHAGIAFDVAAYRSERFGLTAGARFVYQRVDEDRLPVPVEYIWSETTVYVAANVTLGWGVTLFGGANHATLDGEQRLSGTVRDTTRFDNGKAGGFVGIDFEIEPRGHIGLIAESGLRTGGQIYFLHHY